MEFNLREAKFLIRTARLAIDSHLSGTVFAPKNYPAKFNKKAGLFVSLHTYPKRELRGCIGFIEPAKAIISALRDAAISSTMDPRFEAVGKAEMKSIVIDLTLLGGQQEIKVSNPNEYPQNFKVGEHGLIVESSDAKGVLLPQVPIEYGWNEFEFLCHTCLKAGLPQEFWLNNPLKVFKFSGKVFSELSPNGEVVEKILQGWEKQK